MSQADNYTPQEVTGTTATLDVVLPWTFDGIDELEITQTDGVTVVSLDDNDFDAFVDGQTVTVENYYEAGNLTTITVGRATKKTQEFTQSETNPLDSVALNAALDKIVRMIQDVCYKTNSVYESLTEGELYELLLTAITSEDPFVIPPKENRESVWMGFDANGNLFLGVPNNVEPPGGPVDPENYLTIFNDIKIVVGTTYTLLDSDTGKFIIFTNAADVTVTSPNNLTLGHQVMYLKTGADNSIIHIADSGAEHVNSIPVVASKEYAWYSHVVFENTGGVAAKYRFIGEIDETDVNDIEEVSRTILIEDGFTRQEAQDLIDSAGKFLNAGVELKIMFEDQTMVVDQAIVIAGFRGPGILTVATLTDPAEDATTARTVTITNSNTPDPGDYTDFDGFDTAEKWEAFLLNSAFYISGNTCSQISIYGFSFNATVYPVVFTGNSAKANFKYNFCNQIDAFTLAELGTAAGMIVYGGMILIDINRFTTDTDSNGMTLRGTQVQLRNNAGNGGYLVYGDTGVVVAEGSVLNPDFAPTVNKYRIQGVWTVGETIG